MSDFRRHDTIQYASADAAIEIVQNKVYKHCAHCNSLYTHSKVYYLTLTQFCSKKCAIENRQQQKELKRNAETIAECIGHQKHTGGANRFNAVRSRAQRAYKQFTNCQICGYSKHVEVCHIKPVSSFDLNTPLKIVNAPENIAILCRNHHWELDNGILLVNKIPSR